jgi:hypothetical protein
MAAHDFLAVTRAQLTDPTAGVGGRGRDRTGRACHAHGPELRRFIGSAGLVTAVWARIHARLVGVAPPSSHRLPLPLPATTHQTAAVGLVSRVGGWLLVW